MRPNSDCFKMIRLLLFVLCCPESLFLQGMRVHSYDDELLHLAEDLARRMLPAFDTPTGIVAKLLWITWFIIYFLVVLL